MTAARDQIAAVAHQLEGQAQHMHQQLLALPQLQQELQALQELHQRLQKDNQLQLQVCAVASVAAVAIALAAQAISVRHVLLQYMCHVCCST
jgi:hypothetical protein